MNKERLLKLADHLDTVNPAEYSLSQWHKCAVGHAAKAKLFPGLVLSFWPVYEGKRHWEAVGALFDMAPEAAGDFFRSDRLDTPKHTAKRIRELCNGPQ